jgi:DNA-binding transcriptional ArsR family regulator
MSDQRDLEARALAESSESVAELLRAAAHPARVRVLALLSEAERELTFLVQETRLSKNALVNHLGLLMGAGLAQRSGRGRYGLTPEGHQLVRFVAQAYQGSRRRGEEERRMMRALYASGSGTMYMSESRTVSRPAEYQSCWLSYMGAMAGSLRSLGVECDATDVGGASGYAFAVNVAKGRTSPAGPTALGAAWMDISKGVQSLGLRLEHWWEDRSYPASQDKPTPEEVELAGRLFDMVRAEVAKDLPVVLWGLHAPEYGIVNGIEGRSYVASTFRHLIGIPEEPVLYYDLKAHGCMDMFMFRERLEVDRRAADEETLERAARLAAGSYRTLPGFVAGPPALSEWADVLSSGRADLAEYFGHSYTAQCWAEGRGMASEYCSRLARRSKGRRAEELGLASRCYDQEATLLKRVAEGSPFVMEERRLQPQACASAAGWLRDARRMDEEAVKHLERALRA